jgi:curli biogenesis system outer membrane secretion channel CsgG
MKTPNLFVQVPLGFFLLLSAPAFCAEKSPTVVVARTEPQGIGGWQPAIGEGLAQMLISDLAKLPNMTVLESVALEDLREERRLGEGGEVSDKESVKKGQWKGADYTFKSVVTQFGSKESNYGGGTGGARIPGVGRLPGLGGFGGFGVGKSENKVRIDWRIIDNATREIVKGASGSAEGIETGTSFNFSSAGGSGFSNNREFLESALGKATVKAINVIVEDVKKINLGPSGRTSIQAEEAKNANLSLRRVIGSVDLVDGKEIWISLGAKNGFAKGDKIKIYKPIEKKNQAGKVILTIKKEVGEIVLSKVQKDKSMGEFKGDETVGEGWLVADAAIDIDSIEDTK